MPWSQPELLFHEILRLKEPLDGSSAVFHFGTEPGGPVKKITLHVVYFLKAISATHQKKRIIVSRYKTLFFCKMNTRHMKWILRLIPLKDIFMPSSFLCFNSASDFGCRVKSYLPCPIFSLGQILRFNLFLVIYAPITKYAEISIICHSVLTM